MALTPKHFRIYFLILSTVILPAVSSAQYVINALPRWTTSVHLDYMWPQSPVDRFLDNDQWGYHIEFQYRLQYNKPFLAGIYWSEAGLSKYVLEYTQLDPDGNIDIREKANTRAYGSRYNRRVLSGDKLVVTTLSAGQIGICHLSNLLHPHK